MNATGIRITRIQKESVFEKRPRLNGFFGGVGGIRPLLVLLRLQAGDVRQVTEVLSVIQSVPDEELVRCVETHELRGVPQVLGNVLVEQRAHLEGARASLGEKIEESAQRPAGIHDVLDEQNVLAFQCRLRIIHQSYASARHRRVAVSRRDQNIYLQLTTDLAHEVAQEDEAPLEQTEREQVAIRVRVRDLAAKLAHTGRDLVGVQRNPLDRPPVQARIFNGTD